MGKICFSIGDASCKELNYLADTRIGHAIEVRLDLCSLSDNDIREFFSRERSVTLLAAYHAARPSDYEEAGKALTAAILAGADYVDIDFFFPEENRRFIVNLAFSRGCKVIISYHNNKATDSLDYLLDVAAKARQYGADIVKIVTTAVTDEDPLTVLSLYDHLDHETLIAFAMGEKGKDSRLLSYNLGAPFFYVSPTRIEATAPGQPSYADFLQEKDFLLKGEVELPCSKSFAQRAIALAALTEGTTKLYGLTLCDDISSAIEVARALFAEVSLDGTTLTVEGHQNIGERGLKIRDNAIFVGESALLARLCIPLAGLCDDDVIITGEKTLLTRKIDEHRGALRKLGLRLTYTDKSYLPVTVGGKFKHGGYVTLNGSRGSQMISGIMIALSQCKEDSVIEINKVTSQPYLDLTAYIASFFGLDGIELQDDYYDDEDEEEVEGNGVTSDKEYEIRGDRIYTIKGGQKISPVKGVEVEKDWSAASIFIAAAAMMGNVTFKGLNLYSRQADVDIFSIIDRCHLDVVEGDDGAINVRKSIIHPIFYDISDAPDLFVPLFLLGLRTDSMMCIGGIDRLRNKESDRAAAFAQEFSKLGVRIWTYNKDTMVVQGSEKGLLRAAKCSSHGDHRLAMALCTANLISDGGIEIDDVSCIDKSFPTFLSELKKLCVK